ncbi:MAG: 16S rRNA (cytidine(1402)-2'-O)-methyltransferase [Clostridiales bacterium]|nr:16S rRNA (cytidine(1402)-2'-O)-methyltransferase [Clostridiales bacterium]
MKGMLYLVATPIGNLSDLSHRAIKVLREVDFIAAEDTRITQKLLAFIGVKKELISYFEHNKRERGEIIAARLAAGESCALVTDAGTPAISDPGEDLVALCAERNIPITSIPGPCAAILGLTLSALPVGRFVFEGFLSTAKNERKKRLNELASEKRTFVLYEAPHKLRATLSDLHITLGNRKIAICRELTKLNEEVIRTDLEGAITLYKERDPRGEYVLVVAGNPDAGADNCFWENLPAAEHVSYYIDTLGMSKMDAIKAAAKDRGLAKSILYRQLNIDKN